MAGSTSSWTKLGSNTNSSINTDSAAEANIEIASNGGINTQVRHECHMWLDDTAAIVTKSFDWAIDSDFTLVMNSAKNTLDGDPGDIDVDIEGSVDGENYVKMFDIMTWDAGTATIGQGVYDYEAYGRMPYMRISATPGGDYDNTAKPIKINIFMHSI